ncbi:ABC transporter substrate-binding protein [Natronosporangium hydrolyticum]|uniref:ABC transporter substrate-binding protein n=1 Tax=Natronosporangium hydrolyticum TaxID=2811111 RepID=A0A895Y8X3_9ACTN|nr:ABC transporter substrate-binding protein [Natronosporangium hydrolyticum]QSB12765.1 ABC transporter substrate-binding protein [Natronosporangium hydrolyticum]
MRIVSLLPSTTEILFAVGAGDQVVGVTFECDHPPAARQRRIVSTSALPATDDPAEIDRLVSERMAAGEDLYHLDRGALSDLDADLVVTQDLCAVCAVDVTEVADALAYLACRAEVLTIDPHRLAEVIDSVRVLGAATGTGERADELATALTDRLAGITDAVAGADPVPTLLLEWTEPPFAPGHWVPDMIDAAGGVSVLGAAGQPSTRTSWAEVAAGRPAVVVSAPCGFDLAGSRRLTEQLVATGALPAGVPVWAVDANASFARPGPRLVDGVAALAGILHPDRCGPPDPGLATRVA